MTQPSKILWFIFSAAALLLLPGRVGAYCSADGSGAGPDFSVSQLSGFLRIIG
jgi:hypothetical protein